MFSVKSTQIFGQTVLYLDTHIFHVYNTDSKAAAYFSKVSLAVSLLQEPIQKNKKASVFDIWVIWFVKNQWY